jgi:hypothetical protein
LKHIQDNKTNYRIYENYELISKAGFELMSKNLSVDNGAAFGGWVG